MEVKNVTRKDAFRQAILGGIFVILVAFYATEALIFLIMAIEGVFLTPGFLHPRGEILAIGFSLLILSRTILLWLYARWALRRNIFHIDFFDSNKIASAITTTVASTVTAVFAAIAFAIVFKPIYRPLIALNMPIHRPFLEGGVIYRWGRLTELYGPTLGLVNTILQYLYYVSEGMAMVCIVDAFQTAGEIKGEIKGKKARVPWGMVALLLFWGLPHLAIRFSLIILLWALLLAVILSFLYLKSKKNYWPPLFVWMVYCMALN